MADLAVDGVSIALKAAARVMGLRPDFMGLRPGFGLGSHRVADGGRFFAWTRSYGWSARKARTMRLLSSPEISAPVQRLDLLDSPQEWRGRIGPKIGEEHTYGSRAFARLQRPCPGQTGPTASSRGRNGSWVSHVPG